MRRRSVLWSILVLLVLVLAACGAEDAGTAGETEPAEEATAEEAAAEEPEEEPADDTDEVYELHVGTFLAGISGTVWSYVLEENLDEQYGLDLEVTFQDQAGALFGDFAAGTYPIATGSFDVYAQMASEGVPVEVFGTFAPNTMMLVADGEFEDPTEVAGLRVAAPTATGAYTLGVATWRDWYDFELEDEAEVISVGNPGEALAQLYAGTADVAFVWEPFVTSALREDDAWQIAYDQADDWDARVGSTLHQFGLVRRTDVEIPDEALDRFFDMMAAAQEEMHGDPELADQYAQEFLEAPPGLYQEGIEAGRIALDIRPLDAGIAAEMQEVLRFLQDAGEVGDVPEEYWGEH